MADLRGVYPDSSEWGEGEIRMTVATEVRTVIVICALTDALML